MKVILFGVCFCLFGLGLAQTTRAQVQTANSSTSTMDGGGATQSGKLNGLVRRVRVETVSLLVKKGITVEGPRVVREITTYDLRGQKIDSVTYPAEDSGLVGNKQYLRDTKGNIVEMLLRGDDGSIINKERYDYQFDEFGNWKLMTASIAVYENGKVNYEPFEITYRTIAYYYGEPAPRVITAPSVTPISNTSTTAAAHAPSQVSKPPIDASIRGAGTGLAASDVKKTSSVAEVAVVKPEKSEPSIPTSAAVTPKNDAPKVPVIRASEEVPRKAASDSPQPNQSIPTSAAVTPKNDAPKVPVIRASEEVPRKAASDSPQPNQSIPTSAAVTPKTDAPKVPVIRASEEVPRKAASDSPQPNQSIPTSAAVTPKNDAPKVPVMQVSEEVPRKATSDSPQPAQSVPTSAAVTPKNDAPKVPVMRVSEEVPRKATLDSSQPHQSAASPATKNTSSELRTSQLNQGISDIKILQPGDLEANPKHATDSPAPAPSSYDKGLELLALGRNSEAAEALKQATERDPNDGAAYAKLGIAYVALKQYQEAVVVLKMAIKIKPEIVDAEAYFRLSNAYTELGKFSNALDTIKQALYVRRADLANPEGANPLRSPSLEDLHYSTGLAYSNLRRYREAIEELNQVIALNPKRAQAHYGLALCYLASGNRKSAEKQQVTLEALDPVFAAKVAKLLSSTANQQQGFGFVFKTTP